MIIPTFQELSYVHAQFYTGDDEDRKNYHLDVHCLLNFDGAEVVTEFAVNLAQIEQMGLDIPDSFMIHQYREDEDLGQISFGEFKRTQRS